MKWNLTSSHIPENQDELITLLLENRHVEDPEAFLHPISPLELTPEAVGIDSDMLLGALERVVAAIENKEHIVIYGDYDCDGVCATAVLWETIYKLGGKVVPFIPNRERHGYGLSMKSIEELCGERKPDLLITVDNGIVAHAPFQRLKELGVTTILTDHHEPNGEFPKADFVIHTTKLCGATVSWMLANAIEERLTGSIDHVARMLDLCAIATVADQVPLKDANRSFVAHGLVELNQTKRLGLQLLIQTAGLELGKLDASSINYGLAPRINAMGRLESALDALRALCTTDRTRAEALIGKLQSVNKTRQDLTQQMIDKALARASEWAEESIIIIEDEEFHEGIIGLIASKLTETYYKPSVVLAKGNGSSKGSARSIAGVHITELLRSVSEDLMEVGGHPMAAGLRVDSTKMELFKEHLRLQAKTIIDITLLVPHLQIDCELPPTLVTLSTATALQALAPYGAGNREPLFLLNNMIVENAKQIGQEGKHLKLLLRSETSDELIDAICFGKGNRYSEVTLGSSIKCVGIVDINIWKNRQSVQLRLKDFTL